VRCYNCSCLLPESAMLPIINFLSVCRGDTVEVDTWVGAHGKNGMRRDWHIRDSVTGHTILKATRFELLSLS
jgi:hypothetical protein